MSQKIHELKTLPPFYDAVDIDAKTFEVRKNDRDFQVGDILILREFDGENYTRRHTGRVVTYVLTGGQYGIDPEYCVLGMRRFHEVLAGQIQPFRDQPAKHGSDLLAMNTPFPGNDSARDAQTHCRDVDADEGRRCPHCRARLKWARPDRWYCVYCQGKPR